MRTEKDVEAYLLRLNRRYRVLEDTPGTFLVEVGEKAPPLVVRVEPPLVVVRVQLGDAPSGDGAAPLLRKLLEMNAKQLVHAAYGVDDGKVVISSALELENLDFNELQATMDEIDMALAQPVPGLAAPAKKN